MATAQRIDRSTWNRAALYDHYSRRSRAAYAITVELSVTRFLEHLAEAGRKTYPAQIWALSTVVNRHPEFRMTLDSDGEPAVWDVVDPMFTVLNPERETFAAVRAPYGPDFGVFHARVVSLLAEHRHATELFPQGDPPGHVFDVSSLPWTSFTGFTLAIEGGWEHLAPIVTLGRHVERAGETFLPLALQIHHAAADGFHASRLLGELQEVLDDPSWLERPAAAT